MLLHFVFIFCSLNFWRHSSMLIDHCAKAFLKAFLSPFSDYGLITFHRHHHLNRLVSCNYWYSAIRSSHSSAAAAVSCQKLDHRSLVQVCGTDVLGFLQGLVTNDVKMLETDGSSVYAMMLNVQARLTHVYYFYAHHCFLSKQKHWSVCMTDGTWIRTEYVGWEFMGSTSVGGQGDPQEAEPETSLQVP